MTALQNVILKKQANPYKEFSVLERLPGVGGNQFSNQIFYLYSFHYKNVFKSSLKIKGRGEDKKRKFQSKTQ